MKVLKGGEDPFEKNMELRCGGNSEGQQREAQKKTEATVSCFCSWKLETTGRGKSMSPVYPFLEQGLKWVVLPTSGRNLLRKFRYVDDTLINIT